MNVSEFWIAKVYQKYEVHFIKSEGNIDFKYRPVLIIDKIGNFYKCIPITSQIIKIGPHDRIDIYTNYDFNIHSQILCGKEVLLATQAFKRRISICRPEDFSCILDKHKRIKLKNMLQ